MECFFHFRNIQGLLSDGKTPHERRFGEPFNGPAIPFGAMVEYHPNSAKNNLDCVSLEHKSCRVCFSVMHCTREDLVNTIHPAPEIHEHFMTYNRLRNTAYIFTHNLNNPETTVTNYMNAMTHTDVITAHH